MRLLDTSGGGSSLTGGLGSKLLTRGLATSGFTYVMLVESKEKVMWKSVQVSRVTVGITHETRHRPTRHDKEAKVR